MRTALEPPVIPKVDGWICVPKGAIAKIVGSMGSAGTTTAGAEARFRKWLGTQPVKPIPRKRELLIQAQMKFQGLSRRGFDRAWRTDAPGEWRRPGRKS